VPVLQPYILPLCLATLAFITIVNLRGVKESGVAFMAPTYVFIVTLLAVLAIGLVKTITSGGHPEPVVHPPALPTVAGGATLWILMRSFASGCTAMTGVEAVSNGVNAFREPSVVYARRTLSAIIALLSLLLAGIAYLCHVYGVGATEPGQAGYDSVLSQLVAAVVGKGVFYYITIGSVLVVLALSANTGFADFPRLCRVIAQDGYLPNAFAHRGRRLVYSHGILVLAGLSGTLLVLFRGITDSLIPLFAVGAFLAFTLSQAGMVEHWRREKGPHASKSMAINGLGAACTGVTLAVVLVSKFAEGAWITVLLVPTMLLMFYGVHRHYRTVAREVITDAPLDAAGLQPPIALLPIRGWSAITRKALRMSMKISPEVYALHIAGDEQAVLDLEDTWSQRVRQPSQEAGVPAPKLIVIFSPFRQLYGPLMDVVADLQRAHPGRDLAVIVPELVATRWYHYILHNHTAAVIKAYLLFSGLRRVIVVNVPWYLTE
jgi:Amino acid permease